MKVWQIFLLPISLLYGVVVGTRNIFYNCGILKSTSFKKPIILIGNLTVGGTGKTPHVEFVNNVLRQNKAQTAVLSRGYKRKKKGLIEVQIDDLAREVGDEPLQIKQKFPKTLVVCEGDRKKGLEHIFSTHPEVDVVIMDDGFQHRAVKPSLSILLKDYNDLGKPSFLVPAGRMRESSVAERRADVIIITKTPNSFSPLEKRLLRDRVKCYASQQVFFSYMVHGKLLSIHDAKNSLFDIEYYSERNYSVFAFSGIANATKFHSYINENFSNVIQHDFADHHDFTIDDLRNIIDKFSKIESQAKIIITTEKDAMRLMNPAFYDLLADLPLFYVGISVDFHHNDKEDLTNFLLKHADVKKKEVLRVIKL